MCVCDGQTLTIIDFYAFSVSRVPGTAVTLGTSEHTTPTQAAFSFPREPRRKEVQKETINTCRINDGEVRE